MKKTWFKHYPFDEHGLYSYFRAIKCEKRTNAELFSGGVYTEAELEKTQFRVELDKDDYIYKRRFLTDGTLLWEKVITYKWQMMVRHSTYDCMLGGFRLTSNRKRWMKMKIQRQVLRSTRFWQERGLSLLTCDR